jgi:hypothetical protein
MYYNFNVKEFKMAKERKVQTKIVSEDDYHKFVSKINFKPKHPGIKEIFIALVDGEVKVKKISYSKKVNKKKVRELKEWEKHWENLLDFSIDKEVLYAKFNAYFIDDFPQKKIEEIFEQKMSGLTKSIHYSKAGKNDDVVKRHYSKTNPKYPIYIISKGRADQCLTADNLIKMEVPFRIVIEKQEWEKYAKNYPEEYLLELNMNFKKEFDPYIKDFPEEKSKGSGPARNFVWNHAKESGAKWHWIMDDNLDGFCIFNHDKRIKITDGGSLAAAEDFINRYENIAISGLNYRLLCVPGFKEKPYVSNTKIYSCLLIRNDTPIRWAGRYNEDVDICLRALKEGYSTIQFDAFLSNKLPTQTMGGGNTEAFYAEEGTLPKSKMLQNNHPDVTRVVWRFSRWHHIIDYSIFGYYRDRTVRETIFDMAKKPLLKLDQRDVLKEIKVLDLSSEIYFENILLDLADTIREEVIDVIKFWKFKKDNLFIIKELIKAPLLNVDDLMFLNEENEDERIVKTLLKDGDWTITKVQDWESILPFITKSKRNKIVKELLRNKYLLKDDIEVIDHGFGIKSLTADDHKFKRDSKAHFYKNYRNMDIGAIPETLSDKVVNNKDIRDRKDFNRQLVLRGQNTKKEEGFTLAITGDEDFTNRNTFLKEVQNIIHAAQLKPEVISNGVLNRTDYFSAEYSLNNGLKAAEFVPDFNMNGKYAIINNINEMVKAADAAIVFIKNLDSEFCYMVDEMKKAGKDVWAVQYGQNTVSMDDLF